jgi:signal peptidase I
MEPSLRAGDWVVASRRPRRLRRGDVVVVEHPRRPGFDLVKRVEAAPGEPIPYSGAFLGDEVWVVGDNPAAGSVDSRTLGPIPLQNVRARVLARYRPLPPVVIARR